MAFTEQLQPDIPTGDEKKVKNTVSDKEKNTESKDGLDVELRLLSQSQKNEVGIQLQKDLASTTGWVEKIKLGEVVQLPKKDIDVFKKYVILRATKTTQFSLVGWVDATPIRNPQPFFKEYITIRKKLVDKWFPQEKLPWFVVPAQMNDPKKANEALARSRAMAPLLAVDDSMFSVIKDNIHFDVVIWSTVGEAKQRFVNILANGKELEDVRMNFEWLTFNSNLATMEKMSPETKQSFHDMVTLMNLPQFQNEKLYVTGHIEEDSPVRREKWYKNIPENFKQILKKYNDFLPDPVRNPSLKNIKTLSLSEIKWDSKLLPMKQELTGNKKLDPSTIQKIDWYIQAYLLYNWPYYLSKNRAQTVKDYIISISQQEEHGNLYDIKPIDPNRIEIHAAGNSILNQKAITYKFDNVVDTLPQHQNIKALQNTPPSNTITQ